MSSTNPTNTPKLSLNTNNSIALNSTITSRSSISSRNCSSDMIHRCVSGVFTDYTSILSDDTFISQIDVDNLSNEKLVKLVTYINKICREVLPVKCILLALKTLIKTVKCQLVEICHVDKESNLVVNYMMKECMLHKKDLKYMYEGVYSLVLTSGSVLKVRDAESDSRFVPEYDQHTDIKVKTLLILPLYKSNNNIWGTLSLINLDSSGFIKNLSSKASDGLSNLCLTSLGSFSSVSGSSSGPELTSDLKELNKELGEFNLGEGKGYDDPPSSPPDDSNPQNQPPKHLSTATSDSSYSSLNGSYVNSETNQFDAKVPQDDTTTTPNSNEVEDDKLKENVHLNFLNNNLEGSEKEYTHEDEDMLRYIYEFSYVTGIFISNVMDKSELEISRDKSNSLLTLMHSLFSDQLGIQSCIIALTTHAKKLIQVESCTVYIVDKIRNQLWSISSNTGEQLIISLDNNNSILTKCVKTSNTVIYDDNYNCDGNLNKNVILLNHNSSISEFLSSEDVTTTDASSDSSVLGTSNVLGASSNNNLMTLNSMGKGVNGSNSGLVGSSMNSLNKQGFGSQVLVSTNEFDSQPSEPEIGFRNGIWIPIKNENNVLAVIEVINKQAQELLHFTEEDLNLLELFSVIVAPQFERSEFGTMGSVHKTTEAGLAFENVSTKYSNNANIKTFIEQSIKEEEEDVIK